jgi:hypothetical protein
LQWRAAGHRTRGEQVARQDRTHLPTPTPARARDTRHCREDRRPIQLTRFCRC